jgi:hypothetical protein
MKRFILWIVIAIIIGAALGGTFIGGITLGKSQEKAAAQSITQNQFAARFGQSNTSGTNNQTGMASGTNQPDFARRGTVGTVENIDGNKITLKTIQGTVQFVTIDSNTTVSKTVTGSVGDIAAGTTIQVTGETQTDGSITANNISVTPDGLFIGGPMQPPTTTISSAK